MTPAGRYHYSVHWSEQEESFIGSVLELPSLSHLEGDPVEAFRSIWALAHEVVDDFKSRGEWVPEPLSGEAGIRAHARDVAYRVVTTGTYKAVKRSIFHADDEDRATRQERPR